MFKNIPNQRGLWIFILFWSGVTLLFDGGVIVGMIQQMRAVNYPTAQGVILKSDVEINRSRDPEDNDTYQAVVTYRFEVNGQTHESDQYRYNDVASNDSRAKDIVDSLPPGTRVTVFYNPDDPSDAVLVAAVEGMDLALLLFLTPFNVVMVVGWWIGFHVLTRKGQDEDVVAVNVKSSSGFHTVRLPHVGPLPFALATLMGTSFASIFIVMFAYGTSVSLEVMEAWWTGLLGFVLVVYLWRWMGERVGRFSLKVDEHHRQLILPGPMFGARPIVPFDTVQQFNVKKKSPSSSSDEHLIRYRLMLKTATQTETKEIQLGKYELEDDANAMATWLRGLVGDPK